MGRFDLIDAFFCACLAPPECLMIKSTDKASLSESGFKYITALTNPQVRKLARKGVMQVGLFDQTIIEVQTVRLRLVFRRNEFVRVKERRRREDKLAKLRRLVDERNAFAEQAPRAKPEAGQKKLTAWAKHHKLASFCPIELQEPKLTVNIDTEKTAETALLDGCYVLKTDGLAQVMDDKTVDERYRSRQKVKRNFRTLKNGFLEIYPFYLQKAARIQGHALICTLALKIVNDATRLLKETFPRVWPKDKTKVSWKRPRVPWGV